MSLETAAQRQARMYEEAVSRDALERQKWLSVDRYPCCGERFADGHHLACSKRPEDAPVSVHPDQGALA